MTGIRPRRRGLAERVAMAITRFSGSGTAFLAALALVVIWLVTGPIFDYSSTYARLAEMAGRDSDLQRSHSIEEADARHESKLRPRGRPPAHQGAQKRKEEHRAEESNQPAGR